jgi:DNA repair protein RecN (Recombination protein N)
MLKLLKIRNIAVVASAEVEFGPGLNLLTGETGAGKSILVDALGLLIGGRASADLLRTGESSATVEGVLEGCGLGSALEARGLPSDGDELVVRQEIGAGGKGRASANGALVSVATLRELSAGLVEIHGQHEQRGLLDPDSHGEALDRHAGASDTRGRVAALFAELRAVEAEQQALHRDRRELERQRETLEFQATEIEKARVSPGEDEALLREKLLLANAGRLAALCDAAYALLYEDEGAVLGRLGQVFRRVEELAGIDPGFAEHLQARSGVQAQLEDLALHLRDYRGRLAVAPGRLDEVEGRLAALERLKRKYGASLEEVIAFAARCRGELRALAEPELRERELQERQQELAGRYRDAARELSRARRGAAAVLEEAIGRELRQLAMEKARFSVAFAPEEARPDDRATWTATGLERAEFLLSPNPGEELRPLARVASGGELSRLLLALESAALGRAEARTLVFDEVDAGIGGRVAEIVGRRLRDLGRRHQVLCVTHLPQIAALADTHHAVRKESARGRTHASVVRLDPEARVEEVARMLAGETVTEAARRHAREMIKSNMQSKN